MPLYDRINQDKSFQIYDCLLYKDKVLDGSKLKTIVLSENSW